MKVYSIGRDTACDICINDSTDVISRRHAILNVTPTGKMTIVDQSHNGTYVNGIRISPNVPVPVTRKDSISFAHVARLDWNRVPKSGTAVKYAVIGFGVLVCVAVAGFGLKAAFGGNSGASTDNSEKAAAVADTAKAQKEEKETEEKTEKKDSETKKADKADSPKKDNKKDNKKEQTKKDKPEAKKSSGEKNSDGSKTSDKPDNNDGSNKTSPGYRL